MTSVRRKNVIIPPLTGLRAFAAGIVFFYHWFFHYADDWPLLIGAPFRVGYVGVPIFFALSGFLITLRYYDAFIDGHTTYRAYIIKRLIRIFPLYLFVLTFFVAAFGRPTNMIPNTAFGWVVLYTLTQAFFPDLIFLGTLVGWTLSIELVFYFIAPFILLSIARNRSMRAILFILAALSIGFVAIGYLISRLPAVWLPHTIIGQDMNWLMHYSIFGHLPDFLIGILFAFIYLRRDYFLKFGHHASKIIWGSVLGIYLSTVALDFSAQPLGSFTDRSLAFLVALFSSGLILGTAYDKQNKSVITRLLSARWMIYLGLVSYALYLIQLTEPVQWLYWLGLGEYAGVENRILRAILLYIIVIPITILLYKFVEKPSHRWLRNLFQKQLAEEAGGKMKNKAKRDWLSWAKRIQSVSQSGLTFAQDPFDVERYEQLQLVAAEMMSQHCDTETAVIHNLFTQQTGYATPKVGVRAAVFRENGAGPEILMVKETYGDALWTVPGGYADVGDSPSEAIIREVREETGYEVRPVKLTAVYDIDKQGQPERPFSLYRLFFFCEIIGGRPIEGNNEIEAVDFFFLHKLPPLSLAKITSSQIICQFDHYKQPDLPTYFD